MDLVNFRTEGKIVLGLTGALASGKSTAAEAFKKAGAEVICSDAMAAKYFDLNKDKIKSFFFTLDKKEIAEMIFNDRRQKRWLEQLLHPLILQEAKEIMAKTDKKIIVFDMPILFEQGFKDSFDYIICIYADLAQRVKRAAAKGIPLQDFKPRESAQLPLVFKAQKSDFVLFNNSEPKELEDKVLKICKVFEK